VRTSVCDEVAVRVATTTNTASAAHTQENNRGTTAAVGPGENGFSQGRVRKKKAVIAVMGVEAMKGEILVKR
jgi:hypothetical protein